MTELLKNLNQIFKWFIETNINGLVKGIGIEKAVIIFIIGIVIAFITLHK